VAILYYTGWEAGSIAAYTSQYVALWGGNASINSTAANQHRNLAGEGGNYCVNLDDTWQCAANTVPAGTARWLHFWWKPGAFMFVSLTRSGVSQVGILLNEGAATIYIGATGGPLISLYGTHNPNVPHWIAIEAVCQNAGGLVNVFIDDVLVISFSGDTQAHATLSDWDAWFWGWTGGNGGFFNSGGQIDDVVVTDNTTGKLTEKKVFAITADTDSTPLTLTPSTGTDHSALIDDIPLNDADFNNTAVSGSEDNYTWTTIPTTSSISAVQFSACVTNDSGLTLGQISIKSNVTTVYQSAVTLPVSPTFRMISHIQETDPDTAAAWTDGGLAAIEAGIKFTT
jgi:hypothetical protein